MSFKEAISVKGCKFCVATREDEANKVLVLGNLNLNRLLAAFSIFLAQLAQPYCPRLIRAFWRLTRRKITGTLEFLSLLYPKIFNIGFE